MNATRMRIEEEPEAAVPDAATPARRAELARGLLVAAIKRFDQALEANAAVHAAFPVYNAPRRPEGPAEAAEWEAWSTLVRQADDDYDAAELRLAEAIDTLYDLLAPEGRRSVDQPGGYFVPRAVRHGGAVYVLADTVGSYEPGANIIATYREPMAIALDGGADADGS